MFDFTKRLNSFYGQYRLQTLFPDMTTPELFGRRLKFYISNVTFAWHLPSLFLCEYLLLLLLLKYAQPI